MQKKLKPEDKEKKEVYDEESAFEIIELAIDDINILTRAFQVINNICEELSVEKEAKEPTEDSETDEYIMH